MGSIFGKIRLMISSHIYLVLLAMIVIVPLIAKLLFPLDPLGSRHGNPFFKAIIPIEVIFPECGEQGSRACSTSLFVIADAPLPPLEQATVPYETLWLLPRRLLSGITTALNFNERAKIHSICRLELFVEELEAARKTSREIGNAGFVSAFSQTSSHCIGTHSLLSQFRPQFFLIWNDGRITGWLDCDNRDKRLDNCGLFLPHLFESSTTGLESFAQFSASPFFAEAVPSLLRNLGKLEKRMYDDAAMDREIQFNTSLPGNVLHWDEATHNLLDNILE